MQINEQTLRQLIAQKPAVTVKRISAIAQEMNQLSHPELLPGNVDRFTALSVELLDLLKQG